MGLGAVGGHGATLGRTGGHVGHWCSAEMACSWRGAAVASWAGIASRWSGELLASWRRSNSLLACVEIAGGGYVLHGVKAE